MNKGDQNFRWHHFA